MMSKKLIVGNWKMNGLAKDSKERAFSLTTASQKNAEVVLCPPVTVLSVVSEAVKGSAILLGAQDCHAQESGAFTGDISAQMLKDAGCAYVIVGHSERRQLHSETSEQVAAKAAAAHAAGLVAIICVGETDAQRTQGQQNDVVSKQLKDSIPQNATAQNTVIAYEPVWAIGTGKTASAGDVAAMHAFIRKNALPHVRILYGGSVKAANAAEILHTPNVDGVLVGGASLKTEEFMAIINAA